MKRTSMKRVGKVGKANLEANKLIRAYIQDNSLPAVCEIGLKGCLRYMFMQIAHHHKRAWYKGEVALLAAPEQWVISCTSCHNEIEHNKELTEETFKRLRPITN